MKRHAKLRPRLPVVTHFTIPVYEVPVTVKVVEDVAKEIGLDEPSDGAAGRCDDRFCLVFDRTKIEPGLIVHEISHLIDDVYAQYGYDYSSTEHNARLIEWVFNRVWKIVEPRR